MLTPIAPDLRAVQDCATLPAPWLGTASQLLVLTPRCLQDARAVIEAVRANRAVLVNSAWLQDSPGQRLIDVVSGGIAALRGQAHRISEEVFLFAPGMLTVRHEADGGAWPGTQIQNRP
jgi:FtsZ-interacting cell division protein YlmF